jgi:hypothetical protein
MRPYLKNIQHKKDWQIFTEIDNRSCLGGRWLVPVGWGKMWREGIGG